MLQTNSHRFCVAPMLDCTDQHARYLFRLLSKKARLYTEMIHSSAICFNDPKRWLDFDPLQKPLALQLAGANLTQLQEAVQLSESYGFDEINLNAGCPSEKVQSGAFGAVLMKDAAYLSKLLQIMKESTSTPISVKMRIGVDEHDSEAFLMDCMGQLDSVCDIIILHARKAFLKGLSPKENRNVPPLIYERVYRVKEAFPHKIIIINGGIKTLDDSKVHLEKVDGVMLGRAIYDNPWLLTEVDSKLFGLAPYALSRQEVIHKMMDYADNTLGANTYVKLHQITRHWFGLFYQTPLAKQFRRAVCQSYPSLEALETNLRTIGALES